MLSGLVGLLAVVGAAGLVSRLIRSALRTALLAAQVTAEAGRAEVSARQGDLTGLAERQAVVRQARRERRRQGLGTLLWLLWLVVPAFTAWTALAYAIAAPLWLLPAAPVLPRTTSGGG